jgi:hypothetical protein
MPLNTLINNLLENYEETGYRWLIRTLTGNETKCHDMFRMKPCVFFQLCNVLQHIYGLQHTRKIRLKELVGICLMTLAQGSCNRLVQERFNILVRLYTDICIKL